MWAVGHTTRTLRLLPFVSVTHYNTDLTTPEGWKAELAMLADR